MKQIKVETNTPEVVDGSAFLTKDQLATIQSSEDSEIIISNVGEPKTKAITVSKVFYAKLRIDSQNTTSGVRYLVSFGRALEAMKDFEAAKEAKKKAKS